MEWSNLSEYEIPSYLESKGSILVNTSNCLLQYHTYIFVSCYLFDCLLLINCINCFSYYFCLLSGVMISVLLLLMIERLFTVIKYVCSFLFRNFVNIFFEIWLFFFHFNLLLYLCQCEKEFHVGCLRKNGLCDLKVSLVTTW